MASRRTNLQHQEAVSRRLALLSAELAGARSETEDDWSIGHTRIRPLVVVPDEAERFEEIEPDDEAAPVPRPGRHASRRAVDVIPNVVPGAVRSRFTLGPAQIAVVAVVVAVALAVTCWALVRGDPDQLEAPTLDPASAARTSGGPLVAVSPVGSGGAPDTGVEGGSVTVDVAGKVRRPGIAVLDTGARVVDALKAAGGARRGVDLSALNLARILVDGEQILVGRPAPTGVAASAVPAPGVAGGPLVNLNTATSTELETLPQVGPVTAAAIVAWRDEHGGFSSVEELLEVDGIGDATLGQMAPFVTV